MTGLPHPPVVQTGRQLSSPGTTAAAGRCCGRGPRRRSGATSTRLLASPAAAGRRGAASRTRRRQSGRCAEERRRRRPGADVATAAEGRRRAVGRFAGRAAARLWPRARHQGARARRVRRSCSRCPIPRRSPRARCSRSRGRAGRSGTRSRPPSATAGKDGKLRLLPARAANEQKNRRSEPRYRLALGVASRSRAAAPARRAASCARRPRTSASEASRSRPTPTSRSATCCALTMLGARRQIGNDTPGASSRATRRPGATATAWAWPSIIRRVRSRRHCAG